MIQLRRINVRNFKCFSDSTDFPISLQIFYSTENQRGFKKRGNSPTTFPQQFQLL